MKTVPVAEVEAHLSAYLDDLDAEPVIITRDGAPIAALVPIEDDEEAERLGLAYTRN